MCVHLLYSLVSCHTEDSRDEFITMRSNEARTVTLTLLNAGTSDVFLVGESATTTGSDDVRTGALFRSFLTTGWILILDDDSSAEISIHISTFNTANGGVTVTFAVVAESLFNSDVSDFATFSVLITTRPPLELPPPEQASV